MVIPVGVDLDADAEALQAEIEVGAHGALYPHCVADVFLAVVAVIQRPVGITRMHPFILGVDSSTLSEWPSGTCMDALEKGPL